MKDISVKSKVIKLRKKGYSYALILKEVNVSKSTLSVWLKDIPYEPNDVVWERIKSGPLKSGRKKHNQRVKEIASIKKDAKTELGFISKRDLWMLGLGIYMGEGAKTHEIVRIVNSDPKIVQLSLKWLRECCDLKNKNISAMIYGYPDNNVAKCETYWKKVTGLSGENFRKMQVDSRLGKSLKNSGKLPFGTIHLSVVARGNHELGVRLHRKIMGWIEGLSEKIK